MPIYLFLMFSSLIALLNKCIKQKYASLNVNKYCIKIQKTGNGYRNADESNIFMIPFGIYQIFRKM